MHRSSSPESESPQASFFAPRDSGTRASLPILLLVGTAGFLVCYLRSFLLPHTPILHWGDQLGFATKGARLLRGELPYRDFFEFLTPGTDLVYAALFRFFGISMAIPNLVMAFLAAAMAWMMTWCTLRMLRPAIALLPAALLTGFVLHGSLDATHHWFSTVLVMAAVCALFDGIATPRIATAGVLIGLAASFTQSKGAAALIGLFLYFIWMRTREHPTASRCWKRCLLLGSCALLTFAAVNVPFIMAAGLHRWIDQVIIFPLRYFGSVPANNWRGTWPQFKAQAGILKWICFPFIYFSLPLTYVAFFATLRRDAKTRPDEPWDRLLLLAIAGISMLIAVLPALSIRRISCVSPPAMILLAWLLNREPSSRTRPRFISRRWLATGLGFVSVIVAFAQIAAVQLRPPKLLTLPAGTVAIPEAARYDLYLWTSQHTRPGQWYFGVSPLILPLGLRDATALEGFGPGDYTRPEQVASAIAAIDTRPTPLMILIPEERFLHFGATGADHLGPFYDYVHRHYKHTKTFSDGSEVWERAAN